MAIVEKESGIGVNTLSSRTAKPIRDLVAGLYGTRSRINAAHFAGSQSYVTAARVSSRINRFAIFREDNRIH